MSEQVTGRVVRASRNGFQLAGREGWLNVSRYAEDVAPPAVGAEVTVELDSRGFVRSVAPAGPFTATAAAPASNGHAPPAEVDRETAITRMAALNTATAILGGGPGYPVEPAEAVALAARLAAWVRRME
jgi:hypothetical protein